jgi:hypothetical protein
MALYTYFRNRIDACVAAAGLEIERLLLLLEAGEQSGAAPAPRPAPIDRAAPTSKGAQAVARARHAPQPQDR